MALPDAFVGARYALLHGDDADGRVQAIAAWKARHVDPEWEDFSLITCPEGCQWPFVQEALMESAPLGANRAVIVPHADNLLERAKELPPAVKKFLASPLEGTCLLLVARGALSAAPGKMLSAKPFSDWNKEGRALKLGALDSKAAAAFLEAKAKELNLTLESGVAQTLAGRLGGNPGALARGMEVLDLIAEGRRVTRGMVDQATFRLGEQSAFAWKQAWQKGQVGEAIRCLKVALEDEPDGAPLRLLGQARGEVERLCCLHDARRHGLNSHHGLMSVLGLTEKQAFLLDGYKRVLDRIRPEGLKKLVGIIVDADSDIKGGALSRSATPLVSLTVTLCRAWQ
jgi:DNA polymerase III delta subunit